MTRQLSTLTAGAFLLAMNLVAAPVRGQTPPTPPSPRPSPSVGRPAGLPGRPVVVAPAAAPGAKPATPPAAPAANPAAPTAPAARPAAPAPTAPAAGPAAPAVPGAPGAESKKNKKGKKGLFPGAPETAPAPGGVVTTGTGAEVPGEKEFNSCKKLPAGKRIVKLNMKPDTELGDLVNWISSITCRQFLIPNTIPANSKKVTIIAPQLITPEEAYRLFLASLDSVGLTVQPSGKFLRIIESMKAKTSSIPVYGFDQDMPGGEAYVTRMTRVENGDPNEVAQVLARIKGEQGDIVVYPPTGTLIITDQASNIARMMGVLGQIDTPATGEKVWIVRLHNMAASEMSSRLAEIFQVAQVGGKKGGGAPPPSSPGKPTRPGDILAELTVSKIIPDERSNQLIIIANERAYARLLQMIRKLDVPLAGGDGRVHVYYCENANCDELAQTLGIIVGVPVAGAQGVRTSTRSRTSTPTPTPMPTGQQGQQTQGPPLFEGDVRITFDRPTNSLVVLSSLKDYQSIRRVIERLDSPRKQVFVEALIMEVSIDRTRTLGASFHVGGQDNLTSGGESTLLGGFGVKNSLFPAAALSDSSALGLLAGLIGPQKIPAAALGIPAGQNVTTNLPAFGVIIKALQTNNDVNVLSNPHLLITNNDDGEIVVGQNLPFPGALPLGGVPSGAGTPYTGYGTLSVQRQDVALKLKLTPHVNEHNMIRLEVDQEISDILSANFNNLGPSTSKRTAKTTVVARDQQTIVIGGLMSDRVIEGVTKIPLLGDIPILGFFFRTTTKTIQKSNILIAMTPYVVSDQSDLRRILEKKMKERREFIDRFGRDLDTKFDPEANRDYRRKRGMLEEINRAVREVEVEEREMNEIRQQNLEDSAGPLELPAGFRVGGVVDTGVPAPAAPAQPPAQPAQGPAPAAPAPAAPAPYTPPAPPPPIMPPPATPTPAPAR